MLLAINLNLKRGILLRIPMPRQKDSASYNIMRRGSITLQDRIQGFRTTIPSPPMAPEPYNDVVEEQDVATSLELIKKTNIHMLAFDENIKKTNIKLALIEYETAMSSFMSYIRFKHLFNVFEIMANYDGNERYSSDFDMYLGQIIDIDPSKTKSWRELYNRLKHVVKSINDIHTLVSYATDLARNRELLQIREKAEMLIKKRIVQTYKG